MTGGRRTKASDRDNTNTLWEDGADKELLDGEDPLVNEFNEDVSMKVYKPVFDGEGFICSRMKPRIQVCTWTCITVATEQNSTQI